MLKSWNILLICLSLCPTISVYAANGKSNFLQEMEWSASVGIGKTLKHSQKMLFDFPDYTYSASFLGLYQSQGNREWEKESNFPKYGFILHYMNYNSSILGQGIGIGPSIALNLLNNEKLEMEAVLSMGAGWVTKPYNHQFNNENTAIGSYLNNFSSGSLILKYNLNKQKKQQLFAQLKFLHVSNAAFTIPNLGLNDVSLQLGYTYRPSGKVEKLQQNKDRLENQEKRRLFFNLQSMLARGQKYPVNGPRYSIQQMQLYGSYNYRPSKSVQLGYELEYHAGIYSFLKAIYHVGNLRKNSTQHSAFIGHEFKFGPVGFFTQLGFYLQKNHMNSQFMYQRLGLNIYVWEPNYNFLQKVYISGILKSHLSVADYGSLGLGLVF